MHPDRRRAGRAIRKQRRLERERIEHLIVTGEIWAVVAAAGAALAELFRPLVEAFSAFSREVQTPLTRNHLALVPSVPAAERSEVRTGHPSHSVVTRVHGAPVAVYEDSPEWADVGGWEDH